MQTDTLEWSRYVSADSQSPPVPRAEDIEALGRMIKRATGWGFVDSEMAAESPAMGDMLQLVSAYRRMEESWEDESALRMAARKGFAIQVVEDLLLDDRPGQIPNFLEEGCNWPEWFQSLLKQGCVNGEWTADQH